MKDFNRKRFRTESAVLSYDQIMFYEHQISGIDEKHKKEFLEGYRKIGNECRVGRIIVTILREDLSENDTL